MADELPSDAFNDRLVDRHERRLIIPFCDVHYARLERTGQVPKRVKIGANRVGWSYRELMIWIADRKAERAAADCSPASAA